MFIAMRSEIATLIPQTLSTTGGGPNLALTASRFHVRFYIESNAL